MKGRNRLAISLLIIGGVLLFGSIFTGSNKRSGSPGGFGDDVTVPGYTVEHEFMFKGQSYSMTFWGVKVVSPSNKTFLPVNLYVMTLEQYRGYVENHSKQSLLNMTSTLGEIRFNPEKAGHYFFVLEMLEPAGEKIMIGYSEELKGQLNGLNLSFLQPAQAFLVIGIAMMSYDLLPRLSKKFRQPRS